ncbi:hypothetical protein VTK73DRAFT_8536 [Phialemonium thermophilum]|uniref:GATA-type domain-containing protein n=1 Tax=Phialemonium thermophilum TaxID=223376 RepID=A0ABR3W832_9PEZI
MEAGDSAIRQGAVNPARNPEYRETRPRTLFDRPHREGAAMATTALISPTTPYHPHTAFSSFASQAPTSSMPGLISPVESRRTSDEPESAAHRLPSIQEVISGTKPPGYAGPVSSAPSVGLPSPFSTVAPPRQLSDVPQERRASPRSLQHTSYPPRPGPSSTFSDPIRPALNRPLGPSPQSANLYLSQQPSPTTRTDQESDRRQLPDGPQFSGSYGHHPSLPVSGLYPQPGQLPPGQLPLPGYPISPRHAGPPSLPSPFEPQRPPLYGEDDSATKGSKYEATLNRAFEVWSYSEALHRISASSRTIFSFAEAFDAAAREQHGAQPIPSRLPTEDEVTRMLDNVYMIKKCLEDVRGMVQQSKVNNERARETASDRTEDEKTVMYSEAMKKAYGVGEVKKRRGRSAPPGRCHSCNRIDTPEWRRGPDGARTLCNACGLHYAKLERKRQMEQRSIRPKPADERS